MTSLPTHFTKKVRSVLETAGARARSWTWPFRLTVILTVGFTCLVSYVTLSRYWLALYPVADLGVYNQILYNTVVYHQLFYYPWGWQGSSGSFFSVHFSPILFAILPIYALAPSPETLLLLQSIALGLAAFPLFGLAKHSLGSDWAGVALCATYFSVPLTLSVVWIGFHPEAFLPLFLLSAFYAAERKKYLLFLGWWIAALSTVETIVPFMLLFLCGWAIALWLQKPYHWGVTHSVERRLVLVALEITVAWMVLALVVIRSFSSIGGMFGSSLASQWTILGASSGLSIPLQVVLHPGSAFRAFEFQEGMKLLYLLVLCGSFAFLPLVGDLRFTLPWAGWSALATLSNNLDFYTLGVHFIAYPLPFLLGGAISGIPRVRKAMIRLARWWGRRARLHLTASNIKSWVSRLSLTGLVVCALVSASLATPLLPSPAVSFNPQLNYGWPTTTTHEEYVEQVVHLIPKGSFVATTIDLFSEVSSSDKAYVIPVRPGTGADQANYNTTVAPFVRTEIDAARYILLDYSKASDLVATSFIHKYANLSTFGVQAAVDGIYLYQRGWRAAPEIWVPQTLTMPPKDITPAANTELLAGTSSGPPSLYHPPGLQDNGLLWSAQPQTRLSPGTWRILADCQVDSGQPGRQLTVRAWESYPIVGLTQGRIDGVNVSVGPDTFQITGWSGKALGASTRAADGVEAWTGNLTLNLTWTIPGILAIRGWAISPTATLYLYSVVFIQTSWLEPGYPQM